MKKTTINSEDFRGLLSGLRQYSLTLALVLVIAGLTGCDEKNTREINLRERINDAELVMIEPEIEGGILRFGFDLRGSPDEDAMQYLPFLKYLEEATGLTFELRFMPKGNLIEDELGSGNIQFAALGVGSYLQAHAKYGVIPLVKGLNAEGRAEYQSVIFVTPDSPIRNIDELRGKRFAFGKRNSTQGHLIPQILLFEHGILLGDLSGVEFTGSHYNCVNAVVNGRFDAGGIQDILGRRLAEEGLIRIIYTSEYFPSSGIAANRDVPPEVIEKVKRALIDFKPAGAHAEDLYHWERTAMVNGFTEAQDKDYEILREWSIRLGMLEASTEKKTQ
ncbi:MAG: phosphate/phosphite/phosphonate ABC transporter substrate-binding protein [Candidatus Krumholzibacteriota bacterium]|nr:phosphate/phosphite/phosphonate ABC transporter substrate-binding protein [Candidatus Krumholzibacteriota bacterium]